MPGMGSGLDLNNPVLTGAFRSALGHQALAVLLLLAAFALGWASLRARRPPGRQAAPATRPEPRWRAVLRIGFGLLWVVDGVLQAQPAMVAGLPSRVILPGAASSPGWVRSLTGWGTAAWTYHPVQAAAAAVWIQLGLGVWLLAARRGRWSQAAGLAGMAWGLVVWVFGEAFGGVFAPGLTVLFGAPGAALLYAAAGALIALPPRSWPRLGRWLLPGTGLFLAGMAVLQAWPGRGFWSGGGPLAGMIRSMAQTPQPRPLASLVGGFGHLTAGRAFAVSLIAVVVLALAAAALLTGRRAVAGPAVAVLAVFCLADWVLIEDMGVFGGLGTDPNSMIPLILLVTAAYLARFPATAPAPAPATAPVPAAAPVRPAMAAAGEAPAPLAVQTSGIVSTPGDSAAVAGPVPSLVAPAPGLPGAPAGPAAAPPGGRARGWSWLRHLARSAGSADARTVTALWALGVTVIGAWPMAAAAASRSADPVLARALDGSAAIVDFAAPGFSLTGEDGRAVSLASLRGKTVLLTFLDPVCTSDCPLIAQEFRQADAMLGARQTRVELVAIAANPVYHSARYARAFDRQEGLSALANWMFLSGPLPALRRAWHDYSFPVAMVPAGGMVEHGDVAYVIDPAGRVRTELSFDPGPGTSATRSSFAAELAGAATAAGGL
jgi:cytochrome oxidase Cu insertion factor (SCO1/SenC/PrrC family)